MRNEVVAVFWPRPALHPNLSRTSRPPAFLLHPVRHPSATLTYTSPIRFLQAFEHHVQFFANRLALCMAETAGVTSRVSRCVRIPAPQEARVGLLTEVYRSLSFIAIPVWFWGFRLKAISKPLSRLLFLAAPL